MNVKVLGCRTKIINRDSRLSAGLKNLWMGIRTNIGILHKAVMKTNTFKVCIQVAPNQKIVQTIIHLLIKVTTVQLHIKSVTNVVKGPFSK